MGGISDNIRGFALAISSSIFIGSSFIIKKIGLKRAGASGTRASNGGYSYLKEPWWWAGMITSFIVYTFVVLALVIILIVIYVPRNGHTHMVVYIGICSLMGSLTVMGVKAVAIALKLSLSGSNQFIYFETWFFTILVVIFCVTQLIYLNKALDTFNTAVVSPVYYVMFTTLTILASMIMFKEWDSQDASQIVTEICGFVTILSGTFMLHKTKDMGGSSTSSPSYQRSRDSSPTNEAQP
ncbi:Probable magnesium transporter NIPA2 [Striga hermonthica]|uniref:Probable magnesium transporter n=1 Tax=Striga hermonthica TaxID=68872 RepID=A0A9N7NY06_STRHE|nr:Probable magnesium transporter NIPA2 [Striga hermonthica]